MESMGKMINGIDAAGNMKCDTRKEAEKAAKWFIENQL